MPSRNPTGTPRLGRRAVLAALVGAGVGLAGCLGDDGEVRSHDPDALPTWMAEPVTDVTTDESFAIAGASGPVVLHTFETWCTTCRSQQRSLAEYYATRPADVELLDITIDRNYEPADLRRYAETHGFEWRFGIASDAWLQSLVEDFGQRVTVAPRAPVILVCPDATAHELGKGIAGSAIAAAIDERCA